MFPFLEVLTAISIKLTLLFAHPIFWLVIGFIAFQYMRMEKARNQLFKVNTSEWFSTTLQAIGYGFVGGLFGSFIMVFLGLTLSGVGLIYLWPLALLLMIINPRFLCFAYAGGLLSLASLLFGWPPINVPQILALVAILHLIESVLIYYNGRANAVPVYVKIDYRVEPQSIYGDVDLGNKKSLIGGFVLQRFWPIPLAVLIIMDSTAVELTEMLQMPDWWPLFKLAVDVEPDLLVFSLIPVVAALGYGDMVFARKPEQKARSSAVYLFIYSIILLILAILSEYLFIIGIIASLFSFVGHEAIIYIGRKAEMANQPIYVPIDKGVKVLDVLPKTPAFEAGIRSGDVILAVDGIELNSKLELEYLIKYRNVFEVSFISDVDKAYKKEKVVTNSKHFGVLPVPEGYENTYIKLSSSSILKKWLEKGAKYRR